MRLVCARRKVALVMAVSGLMVFSLTLYQLTKADVMVTSEDIDMKTGTPKRSLPSLQEKHDDHHRIIDAFVKHESAAKSSHKNKSLLTYPDLRDQLIENCHPDNVECVSFRKLLGDWPKDKPKAAFYILTQRARTKKLKRTLESIDNHFNIIYRYPIIIFHEKDLVPLIPKIRTFSKSVLYFQEISFEIPGFLTKPVEDNIKCLSSIGYRHMCRFHSKSIYEQPIMKGIEYYWRLDDDSIILRDVKYDVFKYMRAHSLQYGYSWLHVDAISCTEGLWDAAQEFIKNTQLKTEFFKDWPQPKIYYNNFEIGKMSIWMSRKYADYIDFVDRKGGIFYHRWGDAPIKGIAVAMFVPRNRTHHFKDIGYQHGSYINE